MPATVTVQIIFAGLVALVPAQDQSSARILLPFTSGSEAASDGCKLEKHHPVLAAKAASCKVGASNCDWEVEAPFEARPTSPSNLQGGWNLRRQQVSFCVRDANAAADAPCDPAPFELHGAREDLGMFPASEAQATSAKWIAPVQGAPSVPSDIFYGRNPLVDSLALVERGSLATCHLATLVDERAEMIEDEVEGGERSLPQMLAFRFGRIKWLTPYTWAVSRARAIADSFMVTFDIDSTKRVDILLSSLERAGPPRVISLRPSGGGAAEKIQVWVQNIADPNLHQGDAECHRAGFDKHFQLFHNLAGQKSGVGGKSCPNRRIPRASRFRRNVYDPRHPGLADPVYQPNNNNRCETLSFGRPAGHGGIVRDKQVCGNGQMSPPG